MFRSQTHWTKDFRIGVICTHLRIGKYSGFQSLFYFLNLLAKWIRRKASKNNLIKTQILNNNKFTPNEKYSHSMT